MPSTMMNSASANPAGVQLPVSRTPTSPGPREAFTPALTGRAADWLNSEGEAQLFEREFAPFPECQRR
jgi:hypothetical protein